MKIIGIIVAAFVGVLLAAYFVVREVKDPWLFGSRAAEVVQAPQSPIRVATPQPKVQVPDLSAELLELQVREDLLRSQDFFSQVMQEKLLDRIEQMQGAVVGREDQLGGVRESVAAAVSGIMGSSETVVNDLDRIIGGIEEDAALLEQADQELEQAADGISRAIADLQLVGTISSDSADERNYQFHEYRVGNNDTLASIARAAELEHGVEAVDMVNLIRMFNDVRLRTRTFSSRRASIQVVDNQVLRIPVPKRAGELFAGLETEGRLAAQRDSVQQIRARQGQVAGRISRNINGIRTAMLEIETLRSLAIRIEENLTSLDDGSLIADLGDADITDEEQQLWEAFSDVLNSFGSADDTESGRAAQQQLESVMQRLKEYYLNQAGELEISAGEDGLQRNLQWYERFRERYSPVGE